VTYGRGTGLGGFRPLKRSGQNLEGGGVALFRKNMDFRNFSHKVGFFMFLSNFATVRRAVPPVRLLGGRRSRRQPGSPGDCGRGPGRSAGLVAASL